MKRRSLLRLEDQLAAEEAHLRALGRGHQRGRLAAAIALALAAHGAILLFPAPQASGALPQSTQGAPFPTVVRWIPAAPELPASPPGSAGVAESIVPPSPEPVAAVAVPASAVVPADLDAFRRNEPVAEPLPRVAASLPRGVETLIGAPSLPPPPAKPVWRASSAATRPVVALGGRVDPVYPPAAKLLRLTGSVSLDVEVKEDGTVGAVTVVGVSRRGVGFDTAAVAAIRQWRFVPGMRDGRPVTTTTQVEVNFR